MKRAGVFLHLLFSSALFIMAFPVFVYAEGNYTLVNGCHHIIDSSSNTFWFYTDNEVRAINIRSGSTLRTYLVSTDLFHTMGTSGQSACPFPGNYSVYTSTKYTIDGNDYYASYWTGTIEDTGTYDVITSYPSSYQWQYTAIYYTYGAGAVAPDPEVSYADIYDLGYSTNIAGQGSAAVNNIDVLSWNGFVDSAGNELPDDAMIDIRVVPGKYTDQSRQGLLEKLYSDFILDNTGLVELASVPASSAQYTVGWREVIDQLNIPFATINSLISVDDTWLKYGWIYECRLTVPSVDYVGTWQTVYTSTSSGVGNDMSIIENNILNQTLIQTMNNINTINNNSQTIWYINDAPVDPDPEYQPPEDDSDEPWYMRILEMIYNSLGLTNQYINEGTSESQNVVNEFNDSNDDLVVNINEYDEIEDDLINDFNENLEDVDLESDLLTNSDFMSSARWLSEQFTTLTTDNPIGSVLKFSLIFGFILIFLGRFR